MVRYTIQKVLEDEMTAFLYVEPYDRAELFEKSLVQEISKSQVSALAKGLDAKLAAWRKRPLEKSYPYLMVGEVYEKVRHGGAVVSRGVQTVSGIDTVGYREALGVWCADTKSETSWSGGVTGIEGMGTDGGDVHRLGQ